MDDLAISAPHAAACSGADGRSLCCSRRAGRPQEEGHRIRQALLRHGCRMREQSSSLMGNAAGIAIEKVAMCRPEGILAPTKQKDRIRRPLHRLPDPHRHAKAAGQERHWAAIDASSRASNRCPLPIQATVRSGPAAWPRWWECLVAADGRRSAPAAGAGRGAGGRFSWAGPALASTLITASAWHCWQWTYSHALTSANHRPSTCRVGRWGACTPGYA